MKVGVKQELVNSSENDRSTSSRACHLLSASVGPPIRRKVVLLGGEGGGGRLAAQPVPAGAAAAGRHAHTAEDQKEVDKL